MECNRRPDIFQGGISDFKTYGDHRCNLKCNVDLE